VDHIDRNKENCHISNLRWIDDIGNKFNTNPQHNSKSGIKNISKKFNKWRYKKLYDGNELIVYHYNKQFLLWVKFMDALLIKKKYNL
jgi:hypothetical protein